MSTPAQATANRANAQHSTGPRTDAGKAAVGKNARTHGLTATKPVVQPGEEPEFEALSESLRASLCPDGAIEEILFGRVLHASWNLQRLDRLESGLMTSSTDPLLDESCAPAMDRLMRYRATSERTLFRALKEFREQQTLRAERLALPPEVVEQLPPHCRASEFTKQIQISKQTQRHATEVAMMQELHAVDREIEEGLRIHHARQAARR
jgi:hypothetical protein